LRVYSTFLGIDFGFNRQPVEKLAPKYTPTNFQTSRDVTENG